MKVIKLKIDDIKYNKEPDGGWSFEVQKNGYSFDDGLWYKKKPTLKQIEKKLLEWLDDLENEMDDAISEFEHFKYKWFEKEEQDD